MAYIIAAVVIVALLFLAGFVTYLDIQSKRRFKAAVARVSALPMNERLEELARARRNRSHAHYELNQVRRAFNNSWGYRRNPYFSRLLIAQSAYQSARVWVRTVEGLCNEQSASGE